MRQYNLSVMMKPPVTAGGNSNNTNSNANSTSTTLSAAASLDLLRQNIQRSINTDIQSVISKYMDIFVKPGIDNLRTNLGQDAVTEEHIATMCRQILEEAKQMYPIKGEQSQPPLQNMDKNNEQKFSVPQQQSPMTISSQQLGPTNGPLPPPPDIKLPLTSPSSFGIKRESDTDSEASCMSSASKKPKKSKVNNSNINASAIGGDKTNNNSDNSNGSKSTNDSSSSPSKSKKPSGPFRKHVAMWDSNKLTPDTLFIMGAKANKALGFAQTRGRLYVKHPGLFKYASDADDKEWLSKNKLMPATGGRAYIMLLEDIEKLAKDNALKAPINYDDIKGFKVPDFILDKMKNYINTWKKNYADEDEKNGALHRTRNSNKQPNHNKAGPPAPQPSAPPSVQQMPLPRPSNPQIVNANNRTVVTSIGALNPQPPQPHQHSVPDLQQYQKSQLENHVLQQQQGLNNFIAGNSTATTVLYDPSAFPSPQSHEIPNYLQIEKPPPMYPGQPQQQQQMQLTNPAGTYMHSNQLDPIEQAITKGDWSQVSDRSLLQYALQSTRTIGSWDPQDSFDLIESVTNGSGLGGGGETSPLMQISPNPGAHLTAPPLGPVSPNCELSAVLDQVSAYQYTET